MRTDVHRNFSSEHLTERESHERPDVDGRIILTRDIFFPLALQPNLGLGRLYGTFRFTSVTRSRTVGKTPWTGDQLVSRPLPVHKHRKTYTLNIHTQSGIWTHGPGFRASGDSSCIRPLGYRDRRTRDITEIKWEIVDWLIWLRLGINVGLFEPRKSRWTTISFLKIVLHVLIHSSSCVGIAVTGYNFWRHSHLVQNFEIKGG
jgi:hypothetical protein